MGMHKANYKVKIVSVVGSLREETLINPEG